MAADILLRPDNRSLDYSISDFGHYGVQSGTTVTIGAAVAADRPAQQRTEVSLDAKASVDADVVARHVEAPGPSPDGVPAGEVSHAVAAPETGSTAHHASEEALVPTALGSSTPPAQLLPQNTVSPEQASHDGATDSGTTAPAVAEAGLLDPTTVFTLETVGGIAHAATSIVAGGLGDAAELVVAPVQPLLDAGIGAVEDVAAATAAVAGAVIEPLVSAVDGTTDVDLADLSGANPAAGITTLVDMVSSESLFDLRDAGSAPDAPSAAGSAIDTLVGDVADAAPLLGDTAHHDDGIADDLHHGLGL